MIPVTLLVVAKAPEPGRAKTRLAAAVGSGPPPRSPPPPCWTRWTPWPPRRWRPGWWR
ncbi:hypothetical protein D522_23033 [Mycobacterium avium subsp. paratuberculosis S5]|nr:hypothetical protein D522_23033 [Mycobacterium avium subsp. paratuberculosis S5]